MTRSSVDRSIETTVMASCYSEVHSVFSSHKCINVIFWLISMCATLVPSICKEQKQNIDLGVLHNSSIFILPFLKYC